MQAEAGQLIAERYLLLRELGGDAAFSRWLAQDTGIGGVLVEIAFLPPEIVPGGRAYADLKAAVSLSQELLHTNIASTRAFEEDAEAPFIVFDHVEGRALDECLDDWGTLGEDEAKALLAPLASALDYAHGKGVIHRDVRPGNIIVDVASSPHLIGFCTASEMRAAVARMRGDSAAGPSAWLSPEQVLGRDPAKGQDIYSFAAIAYECLAGHPPFYRGQIEFQIVNAEPEPLNSDTPFTRAVMRALSKDPARRPASCAELLAGDFERIKMPEVVSAISVKMPPQRRPQQRQQENAPQPRRVQAPPMRMPPPSPPVRILPPDAAPMRREPRKAAGEPPIPVHASRKVPTPEEREARQKRLDAVQERRRRSRESIERRASEDAEFRQRQSQGATKTAMWLLGGLGIVCAVAVAASSLSSHPNKEVANAPVRKAFAQEDLGRFASFNGIEFGRIIPETPEKGDAIVFGNTTNHVASVSISGLAFDVELAEPVYKVFPSVRISLVQTPEGRRISGITFEKSGEGIMAAKARKVVAKIASLLESEYGIDMGDTLTSINDTYFGQRYSDNLVDIRISSVVSPESTSISFSIESKIVHALEVVVLR